MRFWRNGLDLDRLVPVDAARKAELRRELDIPMTGSSYSQLRDSQHGSGSTVLSQRFLRC